MFTAFRNLQDNFKSVDQNYSYNEHFIYRLDKDNILITTRHRAWILLSSQEYGAFKGYKVHENPELFEKLQNLNILLLENNLNNAAMQYKQKYSFMYRPPGLLIMIPTLRCNLTCDYCHAESKPIDADNFDMTKETVERVVDFIFSIPRRSNNVHVEIQGGEPLLRWDLVQHIVEYTKKRSKEQKKAKPSFTMGTNLTLMNNKILNNILKYNKDGFKFTLSTSLDGPKHLHDKNRFYNKGKGSYNGVVKWIDLLMAKHKGILSGAVPTLTKHSVGSEKEVVDEFIKHKFKTIKLRYANYTGRTFEKLHKENDLSMSVDEFYNFWKNALEYVLELNKNGTRFVEQTTTHILQNLLLVEGDYMCLRKPCGAAISQLTFKQNGSIHACDGGRSVDILKLGDVHTHTYNEIITSESSLALRSICSEALPTCSSCPFGAYCGYCVARGFNQHDNIMPKTPQDYECKLYKKMIPYLFKKLLDEEDRKVLLSWL